MSVNRELQFMAMLEGHELERELLDVVSILLHIVGFQEKAFYWPYQALGKSATNLQSQ